MSRAGKVVELVARALAARPGDVVVHEHERRGQTVLELTMAPGELGRVIGRQGRTAAALRTLAATAGELDGKKVAVEFRDEQQNVEWASMATVGRIVRPHGNRGHVVVAPETDFGAERFRPGSVLYACPLDDERDLHPLTVVSSREYDGRWVVGFAGVASIDEAEAWRGRELRIPSEALHELEAGAYYVHDLVGCELVTAGGARVGRVERVDTATGVPVLVAAGAEGEVLVPFVDAICRRVDIEARRIEIEPPDGLIELNAPGASRR